MLRLLDAAKENALDALGAAAAALYFAAFLAALLAAVDRLSYF